MNIFRMKTSNSHVIAFTLLQAIIVVLFLLFVRYCDITKSELYFLLLPRYDPKVAQKSEDSVYDGDKQIKDIYPSNNTLSEQYVFPDLILFSLPQCSKTSTS